MFITEKMPKWCFFDVFCEKSTFPVKKNFQNFFYILVNTNPTISPSFVGIGGFLFFGPNRYLWDVVFLLKLFRFITFFSVGCVCGGGGGGAEL